MDDCTPYRDKRCQNYDLYNNMIMDTGEIYWRSIQVRRNAVSSEEVSTKYVLYNIIRTSGLLFLCRYSVGQSKLAIPSAMTAMQSCCTAETRARP